MSGFEDYLWQVPVTIATNKNKAAYKFLLDKKTATVTMEGVGPNDWILVRQNNEGIINCSC